MHTVFVIFTSQSFPLFHTLFPVYPKLIYARNVRYIFFVEDAPFNHFIGRINNCPVTESRKREHCIMIAYIFHKTNFIRNTIDSSLFCI